MAVVVTDARPTLAFFFWERSGASRRAEGFLATVLQRRRNHETFAIVRIAEERKPELLERFRIERLPTLVVIDARRVVGRLEQPRGTREVEQLLRRWLR